MEWRREWDSNPRRREPHWFSRPAPSTTRPSLRSRRFAVPDSTLPVLPFRDGAIQETRLSGTPSATQRRPSSVVIRAWLGRTVTTLPARRRPHGERGEMLTAPSPWSAWCDIVREAMPGRLVFGSPMSNPAHPGRRWFSCPGAASVPDAVPATATDAVTDADADSPFRRGLALQLKRLCVQYPSRPERCWSG